MVGIGRRGLPMRKNRDERHNCKCKRKPAPAAQALFQAQMVDDVIDVRSGHCETLPQNKTGRNTPGQLNCIRFEAILFVVFLLLHGGLQDVAKRSA
jgi:hypothetical protein